MRADVLPIIISCAATGASDTVRLNALWALKVSLSLFKSSTNSEDLTSLSPHLA